MPRFEQFPGAEDRWSIPHIIRNDSNYGNGFGFQAKLSPTAALPGNWVLANNGTIATPCWDIEISSDTAIEWTLGTFSGADPGFTAATIVQLGDNGGTATTAHAEAQVAAAVAMSRVYTGGFATAGGSYHILNKGWVWAAFSSGIYLKTGLTAANVYVTMWWCERNYGP